jgi:hypothetical protein
LSIPIVLSHTGQRLYDALAPFAYDDENQGYALAFYCHALASTVDEIADITRDQEDDTPGYAGLFDLDTVAERYLPWVAQFIGVQVPDHLSDEAKRIRIRETDGFRRGTPSAIEGALRQHLTGTKTAFLVERHGSAYILTVSAYVSETPDPDAAEAAVRAQVPAGIVLNFSLIVAGTFDEVRDSHTDFDHLVTVFFTFDEILVDPTKT